MELHTYCGAVTFSSNSLFINCKVKDLNYVFAELFKLIPKETKIKDLKSLIIKKLH